MVYLKSVEKVITLGKLIGLLFLFCLPLLSILFLKTIKIRGMPHSPCNGNQFSSFSSDRRLKNNKITPNLQWLHVARFIPLLCLVICHFDHTNGTK